MDTLLGPCSFRPPSRALVYHLGKSEMPLDDTVLVNCKVGAATENQGAVVKCMG